MRCLGLAVAAAALLSCGASEPAPPPPPDWASLPETAAQRVQAQYEAFAANPSNAVAAGKLGMLLEAYEQWQAAVRFFDHAERVNPRDAAWPYLKAVALERQGDAAAAQTAYYRTLSIDPSYLPARLRLAAIAMDEGSTAEAEELYRSALALDPTSAAAEYGLASISELRGDDASAVAGYEKALTQAPEYSSARYALARVLRRGGKQAEAERHAAVLEGAPRTTEVFFDPLLFEVQGLLADSAPERLRRGKELADQGLHEEAVAEFNQALSSDPNYSEAHINLMTSYGALGRDASAEQAYQKAFALGSTAPELDYNLGVLRSYQGRFQEAIPAFLKALERDPALADAHSNLGFALEQVGRRAEAAAHYRAALEAQPGHRLANVHYGNWLLAENRPADALGYLEPAVEPRDSLAPRVLFAAAEAHMRLGDPASARRLLEQALELARRFGQQDLLEPLQTSLDSLPG